MLTRARPEEFTTANSGNPSPKKQARVVISPDSLSRKRTRLEDQLSDIQYIDCNTPDNVTTISTTALIHVTNNDNNNKKNNETSLKEQNESYCPKNKSPRNSSIEWIDDIDKTQSSPIYTQLIDSSPANSTPDEPQEVAYENLKYSTEDVNQIIEDLIVSKKPSSPKYENVLTTISITYKSPKKSLNRNNNEQQSIYEDVLVVNPEKALVPTSTASLPVQEASVPIVKDSTDDKRPKSLSALEELSKTIKPIDVIGRSLSKDSLSSQKKLISSDTCSSTKSSELNLSDVQTAILHEITSTNYQSIDSPNSPLTDLSLSEIVNTSTENFNSSQSSVSFPISTSQLSPNVSPTRLDSPCTNHVNDLIQFSPDDNNDDGDDEDIYQQVKYYRRSIHEINALLNDAKVSDETETTDKSATYIDSDVYEDKTKIKSTDSLTQSLDYDSLEGASLNEYENLKFTNDSLENEKTSACEEEIHEVTPAATSNVITTTTTSHHVSSLRGKHIKTSRKNTLKF